jgi:3-hydroxybutyryl-CoA dehydrogenase
MDKSLFSLTRPSSDSRQPSVLAILASEPQKAELRRSPLFENHQLIFAENLSHLMAQTADAFMDLLFEPDSKRIEILAKGLPSIIFVNSVIYSISAIHPDFIRINGWPGFLERSLLEAAGSENFIGKTREIFDSRIQFVKDVPGLVIPRIISMIINEAYFILDHGISSRQEIDVAMKLGTNYPLGPFEWAEKIGLEKIYSLLSALSISDGVYTPAPGLLKGLKE